MTDQNEPTKKIGGWLILVGIGIVLSPVKISALVWMVFSPIFTDGTWEMMTSGTTFYHDLWGPVMISEIVINLLFVLAWIYAGYLFFTKKKQLPLVYIGLISLSFIFIFTDAFAIKLVMPEEPVF